MIPLVDVAVVNRLTATFKHPVVWSSSESAKKAIASTTGQDSQGYTGISIIRTSVTRDTTRANQPTGYVGGGFKFKSPLSTNIDDFRLVTAQKRSYVVAMYDINIFSSRLSDVNEISRTLEFSNFYQPLLVTYDSTEYPFPVVISDGSFTVINEDRTEKIKEYNMNLSMSVNTFWFELIEYHTILTQFVDYYDDMTSGKPIYQTKMFLNNITS